MADLKTLELRSIVLSPTFNCLRRGSDDRCEVLCCLVESGHFGSKSIHAGFDGLALELDWIALVLPTRAIQQSSFLGVPCPWTTAGKRRPSLPIEADTFRYTPHWLHLPPRQAVEASIQDHQHFRQFPHDMRAKGYLRRLHGRDIATQSYLPTFQLPKRDGNYRVIVDCKQHFNKCLATTTSEQPGQREILAWTQTQRYTAKRDLKDAYHCFPINPRHRMHFGLKYRGKYYQCQGMLMGLQDAPSVFQKINSRALQNLNHRTYLDDSFFGGVTFAAALEERNQGDEIQAKLGFRPNTAKSSKINPNATIDILGFYRVGDYLYIPEERILRILRLVKSRKYHKAVQTLENYNPLYPKCATHKWCCTGVSYSGFGRLRRSLEELRLLLLFPLALPSALPRCRLRCPVDWGKARA